MSFSGKRLAAARMAGLGALLAAGAVQGQENPTAGPGPADGATETIPVQPLAQPQEAATDAAPEAAGHDAQRLDDIVVTSTKRAQSMRKIPSSITALNGEELEGIGAREMKDYLKQVPGISLQESSGDKPAKISIRGVGPSDGANQTTGVLLDDIPLTDPYGTFPIADPDPFDMRTVEILKGPQGTLFGASALNGAIRFVQNKPEPGQWSGRGFAEYLSIAHGGAEPTFGGAVNAPLGDSAALRLSGVVQHTPGIIDFVTPRHPVAENGDDVRKWSGRALWRWDATERLSLNASFMRQQRKTTENAFTTNPEGRLERDDAPGQSPMNIGFSIATLDARYDLGWASLVSVSSRQTKTTEIDLEATYTLAVQAAEQGISVLRGLQVVDASGYSQELRLVSPDDGPWTWLGGVYLSRYTADIDIDLTVANTGILRSLPVLGDLLGDDGIDQLLVTPRGVSVANQSFHPLNATDMALFGEISRKLFGTVNVTLGGRYYNVDLEGDTVTGGALTLATQRKLRSEKSLDLNDRGFSPKLALTWEVTPDILAYANASRGFQYGGINIQPTNVTPSTHPTFKSSTLWNYEVGARTDWFDRTLRLDLTLFHLDWKGPQVYQSDDSALGLNGTFIDNVGAAQGNGVEGTFRYLTPIPGLSLSIAGSYNVLKTSTDFTTAGGENIPAGTDMPLSPRVQTATTLGYTGYFGAWVVGANATQLLQGKAYNNIQHTFETYGYTTYNLGLRVARPDLPLAPALSLNATNLGDVRGINGINGINRELPSGVPTSSFPPTTYVRPRAISLRFTAEF